MQNHPPQSQQFHTPYPPFAPILEPRQNPKGYAVAALILFLLGGLLHIAALIPYLGILFGCCGLFCDFIALVFLIIVVVML